MSASDLASQLSKAGSYNKSNERSQQTLTHAVHWFVPIFGQSVHRWAELLSSDKPNQETLLEGLIIDLGSSDNDSNRCWANTGVLNCSHEHMLLRAIFSPMNCCFAILLSLMDQQPSCVMKQCAAFVHCFRFLLFLSLKASQVSDMQTFITPSLFVWTVYFRSQSYNLME